MRRNRSGLTYTNVVATLALFLALSGGAALAAGKITSKQIGKGAVKNKNLAKNAVKNKNLAKNSVTSPKLANGAVKNAEIADGAVNLAKIAAGTDVIATATGGPIFASQQGPFALNPAITVTPVSGQLLTLHIELRGALTATEAGKTCAVFLFPIVNGNPRGGGESMVVVAPGAPLGPLGSGGIPRAGDEFPIGLTQPGVPQSITMFAVTVAENCTADSSIQVSALVTQEK